MHKKPVLSILQIMDDLTDGLLLENCRNLDSGFGMSDSSVILFLSKRFGSEPAVLYIYLYAEVVTVTVVEFVRLFVFGERHPLHILRLSFPKRAPPLVTSQQKRIYQSEFRLSSI